MSSRVYLFFPLGGHEPPPTLRDRLNPHLTQHVTPSLSSPPLCQTPGCRSGRNRSTLSPSHPVLSILHPQGFRKRFASAAAGRSFEGASSRPQKSSRSQRRLNALTPGVQNRTYASWPKYIGRMVSLREHSTSAAARLPHFSKSAPYCLWSTLGKYTQTRTQSVSLSHTRRTGLRGYVQFNKYTHTQTHTHQCE